MADDRTGAIRLSGQLFHADVAELDEGAVAQESDVAGWASEAGVVAIFHDVEVSVENDRAVQPQGAF